MELTDVMAHQGGWDEIILVTAPLLLFAALLVLAKRRAEQASSEPVDEP